MKCSELQDLVLFGAAGVLDADEQRQVQEHLSDGCPRCEGYRAEAEAVLAQLSMTVAPVQPSVSVKKALMNRVRQSLEPVKPAMNVRLPWWRVALPASIAAVLAVALTAGAFKAFPRLGGQGNSAPQIARVPSPAPITPNNEAGFVPDSSFTPVAGHDYRTIDLSGDSQKSATAHLTIDLTDHTWILDLKGLKPTVGNQSYVVWVYGSDHVYRPIGKFELTSNVRDVEKGSDVPKLDLQHQIQILVTIQTDPAVSIPAGPKQLVGMLNP